MTIENNRWLMFILALYFILAVNYALNVPCYESPDEPDHYAYIKYLIEKKHIPFLQTKISSEPSTSIHPPLYYYLGAILYAPLQAYDNTIEVTYNEKFGLVNRNRYFQPEENIYYHLPFYIIRLLSIFLGMGTIIFGWKIAKECFEDNYDLIILSAALIAFVPQFIYISASINCDNLANLVSTIIIWLLIKAAKKEKPAKKDIYLIGIVLGLAAITKFTVLFLIPLAIMVLYIIKNNKVEFFKNAVVLSLMICVVAGWYYLRNYLIYDHVLGGAFVIKRGIFSMYFINPFGLIMLLSFFGLFGWMNILMYKSIYMFYIMFYGIGFLAALEYLIKDSCLTSKYPKIKIYNWILFLSIILSLMSNIRYNMARDDFQGRHMFTIIAPLAILVAQGYYYIYFRIKEKYSILIKDNIKTLVILLIIVILASLNIYIVDVFIKTGFAGAYI